MSNVRDRTGGGGGNRLISGGVMARRTWDAGGATWCRSFRTTVLSYTIRIPTC